MKTVFYSCIAIILLLSSAAGANEIAILHGIVYEWNTFEPLDNAVVEVNSTPLQSIVAKYGVYSFELLPGVYLIKASYYQDSELTHSTEETVQITGEGNYVLDLLLLPSYPEELSYSENQVGNDTVGGNGTPEKSGLQVLGYLILAIIAITVLFHAFMYFQKLHIEKIKTVSSKEEKHPIKPTSYMLQPEKETPEVIDEIVTDEMVADEMVADEMVADEIVADEIVADEVVVETGIQEVEEREKEGEEPLPDDLQEILDIIRSHDGRMTQKELRGRLKYSEGKVSLMLFDLEKRGSIEKFKRGRGNVIILVDKKD